MTLTLLRCDPCGASIGPLPGRPEQIRASARGWSRPVGTGTDLCPACTAARAGERVGDGAVYR